MPNLNRIFLTKFIIFLFAFVQSFNCQANISKLQIADSLFSTKNYQEAMLVYEDMLNNEETFSPAMLLKMAFISEGKGDYSSASFFLAKYYDENPNQRVISKIMTLTEQANLIGYELDDKDRLFKFVTDFQTELSSTFSFLLFLSLILLFVFRTKADKPMYYVPTAVLIIMVFVINNFLSEPKTGIVTGSPTLIMDQPTAGGKLIEVVEPGHRVIIKSTKDVWYEVTWGEKVAYVKKDNITRL